VNLLSRLPSIPVPKAFLPEQPSLACEITERAVSFARLGRAGGGATLAGFYTGELPDGALRPSPVQPNVADAAALRAQVAAARPRVAPSGGPIALCVPDPVARVAILQLETMPSRRSEVADLVAWRLKKQIPYRVEDARVAWQVLGARGSQSVVLAAAMKRRVLAEYEDALRAEGFEPGSVTTTTLALAEALPPHAGDTLLVVVSDGWFSLLWTDATQPLLLRTKQLPASEREGEGRDRFVAAEIAPTLEYVRGRMERTATPRVLVHDGTAATDGLADAVSAAAQLPAERLRATPDEALPPGVAERLGPACSLALRGLGEGVLPKERAS
jgi:hypothetical protein